MRGAAQLAGVDEAETKNRFTGKCVLVRLADECTRDANARETFLFAVNLCLRFVDVSVDCADSEIAFAAERLADEITGAPLTTAQPDVILLVANHVSHDSPSVSVSSDAWLARMATSASDADTLPKGGRPNVLGALAAACLGTSQIFHFLAGIGLAEKPLELSLHTLAQGEIGTLPPGPPLPEDLDLDALLVGCGGVMHGFIYALKRLAITGGARAVDRQRLHDENLGPYVASRIQDLGLEKAKLVRDYLSPEIDVVPYDEDFYPLFTTRLDRGHFPLPPIVVAGLDRVTPRHIVQRLWPELLIDMGAGGETAQLIVKRRESDNACVLELLDRPAAEVDELDRLSEESGFDPEKIRNEMDGPISSEDVARAPSELRDSMEEARQRGQLRCGFIRTRALDHEHSGDEFVAAVPFVVAFVGILAAAEVVKQMMEPTGGLRYQFSFTSLHGRLVEPRAGDCDCREVR
jgi:tRNA A37 threonylcarbamoyladenosine dehydratase